MPASARHLLLLLSTLAAGQCVPQAALPNGPGYGVSLDGVNDYVDVRDGVWFNGDFTVEGWAFVRSYNPWSRLLDFGNYDGVSAGVDSVLVALSGGTTGRPHFHVLAGSTA